MHYAKFRPNRPDSVGVMAKCGISGAFVTKVAKTSVLGSQYALCQVWSKSELSREVMAKCGIYGAFAPKVAHFIF